MLLVEIIEISRDSSGKGNTIKIKWTLVYSTLIGIIINDKLVHIM